jgi:uncharacterized membrane protein YdjX (TVP38/TMEM64 family)
MSGKSFKLGLWFATVLAALFGIQQLLSLYSLAELKVLIEAHQFILLAAYAVLIALRGLLFVPTMPFIILMASTINNTLMFMVTLAASLLSAYLVCLAVDRLALQQHLFSKPKKAVLKAQGAINNYGLYAVAGWAFFPFVFTEIIVYLARATSMRKTTILFAIAVGEGGLIYLVVQATEFFKATLL